MLVSLLVFRRTCLNYELCRKDVGQLSPETISTTCDFLLVIIVVAGSKKLAENHFWLVIILFPVDLYRNAFAVIPDTDRVISLINVNLYHVHVLVPLEIVSSVNQNLI